MFFRFILLLFILSNFCISFAQQPVESTEILVVGGSPAGVAAALASARLGHPVILIEKRPYLGTVMTAAMLNVFDLDR